MADDKKRKSLQTPIGIATFVHLFEPFAFKAQAGEPQKDPQFSVLLVFDKETVPQLKELKLACIAAAEEKFGAEARDQIKKGKISMPWRPASDYEEYGEPFTNPGAVMLNFKSNATNPPGVVDRRAKDIMDRKQIYAGCKMRVSYGVWPYNTKGNKGVTLLLNNAQKAGDGTKLAGRPDAEEEFGAIDGGDGDDMDEGDGDII